MREREEEEPGAMEGVVGGEEGRAYIVEGRVQGVGFRAWTRRTARRLGVRGWVRNQEDGGVEVHMAGVPVILEVMATELLRGPTGARVDRVVPGGEGRDLPARGFEIR